VAHVRFRQSLITTWMSCALQARFQSIDNLPRRQHARATFGTCVHFALELYSNNGDVDAAVEAFTQVWEKPETLGVAPDIWPKYMTYGGWREKGIKLIIDYHDRIRWENREVIGSEVKFLVPFGDHELTGTVDLLESRKNSSGKLLLRVVDFKTNSKAPTKYNLRYNIQFTTYVWASMQPEFWMGNGPDYPALPGGLLLYERFKEIPRRGIWFHLQTNKEIDAGPRDDEDFIRLYRVCEEIDKAITHNVFVPNISGDSCGFCDYTEPCGLAIPTQNDDESWV